MGVKFAAYVASSVAFAFSAASIYKPIEESIVSEVAEKRKFPNS